jgi:hypothetical protein
LLRGFRGRDIVDCAISGIDAGNRRAGERRFDTIGRIVLAVAEIAPD